MATVFVDELSAWRAPIGAFLVNFLTIGLLKSNGILLLAYGEIVEIGPIALILTPITNSAAMGLLAPFAELMGRIFTYRFIVCLSGFLVSLTYSLSSFFMNSVTFYPLFGICIGIGFSLCYSPAISVNIMCFQQRRATAAGVCFSGASVGSMVMPVLITFLLDVFPVRSFLIILGAFMLHLCVAGLLLPTNIIDRTLGRARTVLHQSFGNKSHPGRRSTGEIDSVSPRNTSKETFRQILLRSLPYTCAILLGNFSYITQFFAATLFAGEMKFSRYFIAGFLTAQGMVDLAMRLVSGVMSDKLSNKQKAMVCGIAIIMLGIMALMVAFLPSQATFMIYSVGFASTGAIYMTLWSVILMAIVGLPNFSLFLSLNYMAMGLFNLPMGFVISWIKDSTGSFRSVMYLCGAFQLCSGLACLLYFGFFWHRMTAPNESRPPRHTGEASEAMELNQ